MDFPDPDAPTSATEEPFGTLKDIPFKAVVRPSYAKWTLSKEDNVTILSTSIWTDIAYQTRFRRWLLLVLEHQAYHWFRWVVPTGLSISLHLLLDRWWICTGMWWCWGVGIARQICSGLGLLCKHALLTWPKYKLKATKSLADNSPREMRSAMRVPPTK